MSHSEVYQEYRIQPRVTAQEINTLLLTISSRHITSHLGHEFCK